MKKEVSTGVIILKKEPDQSREDFVEDVKKVYYDFYSEFVLEGDDNLYELIMRGAELLGDKGVENFQGRFGFFIYNRSLKPIDIANEKEEVPIPDMEYFRDIYNRYKYVKLNPKVVKKLIEEFISGIFELCRKIDIAYDSFNTKEAKDCVIYLKKEEDEDEDQFKGKVGKKYREFTDEFIFDEGIYYDMFDAMFKGAGKRGRAEDTKFKVSVMNFCSDSLKNVMELPSKIDEVPLPNPSYFRALHRRYEEIEGNPKKVQEIMLKQVTDDFLAALEEINDIINAANE